MRKKTYYVSVSAGTIEDREMLADQRNYSYEFIVEATEEEIRELRRLFSVYEADTDKTHVRAFVPYKSADHDESTEEFNDDILRIYALIYRLGTPETRSHIESTKLIDKLKHTDYNHVGYER